MAKKGKQKMNQTIKLNYEEFINVAYAVMEATKQKEGKKIDG